MRRNILQWVNNAGAVVFRSSDSFTRTAQVVLDRIHGNQTHLRMGEFSIVLMDHELIAAPLYGDGGLADNDITPTSQFWSSWVRDRERQMQAVEAVLQDTHPHVVGIRAYIEREREHYRQATAAVQ